MNFAVNNQAPRRRKNGNAEACIQAAVVEWIRVAAPGVFVFAVPNGGLRSKSEAARMKWTGTVAGVPDLCVIGPGGIAYFLEVKSAGGYLSTDQHSVLRTLSDIGARGAVVRSIDDARRAFSDWGIKTREHVGM